MEYKKNSRLEVEITDLGVNGEGIGKVEGYTLFVKDAVVGDTVLALITKPKKNYAYAKCEKVLVPSPFRVTPACACAGPCGGCQLQMVSYDRQLQMKQDKVRTNLIRIGGFEESFVDEIMEPIAGMEEPFHYRNKAQYPVAPDKNGNPIAGFYAGRTHSIIANTECKLGAKCDEAILNAVLDFMKDKKIPAYDEQTQKGLVRHVLIRTGYTTGQIMVCLVINGKKLPYADAFIERLCALSLNYEKPVMMKADANYEICSISISVNTEQTNVIMGHEITLLYGKPWILDYIGNVAFQISPLSFFQVNPMQTKVLYETALEYAGLSGTEAVWDLYCGIGSISLFLAQKAGMVYGVEIVPQAIEDAKQNASLNGLENTQFFVGKAEEVLPQFYDGKLNVTTPKNGSFDMQHPDVIVVDPPRKGCDEACLETMLKMQPEKIVYVSCDSATLARDLKILCEKDYEIKRVRPCDMFPMTVHVETVCLLSRKAPV